MPQITEIEEKAMLIQQQMQQQQELPSKDDATADGTATTNGSTDGTTTANGVKDFIPQSPVEKAKDSYFKNKDVIIVLFLSILFNLEVISRKS